MDFNVDVYDLKEHSYTGKNVTKKEVEDLLNLTYNELSNFISKKRKCQGRYLIVRTGKEINTSEEYKGKTENFKSSIPQKLWDEWDITCRIVKLVKSGKAVVQTNYINGKWVRYTEVLKDGYM